LLNTMHHGRIKQESFSNNILAFYCSDHITK
jgi:hypothetical protein